MNFFSDYSKPVRITALKLLAARNIRVWDVTFDPNSKVVLDICEALHTGALTMPDDRTLYRWSRDQLLEYVNHVDATKGKRISKIKSWKDIPQG